MGQFYLLRRIILIFVSDLELRQLSLLKFCLYLKEAVLKISFSPHAKRSCPGTNTDGLGTMPKFRTTGLVWEVVPLWVGSMAPPQGSDSNADSSANTANISGYGPQAEAWPWLGCSRRLHTCPACVCSAISRVC